MIQCTKDSNQSKLSQTDQMLDPCFSKKIYTHVYNTFRYSKFFFFRFKSQCSHLVLFLFGVLNQFPGSNPAPAPTQVVTLLNRSVSAHGGLYTVLPPLLINCPGQVDLPNIFPHPAWGEVHGVLGGHLIPFLQEIWT